MDPAKLELIWINYRSKAHDVIGQVYLDGEIFLNEFTLCLMDEHVELSAQTELYIKQGSPLEKLFYCTLQKELFKLEPERHPERDHSEVKMAYFNMLKERLVEAAKDFNFIQHSQAASSLGHCTPGKDGEEGRNGILGFVFRCFKGVLKKVKCSMDWIQENVVAESALVNGVKYARLKGDQGYVVTIAMGTPPYDRLKARMEVLDSYKEWDLNELPLELKEIFLPGQDMDERIKAGNNSEQNPLRMLTDPQIKKQHGDVSWTAARARTGNSTGKWQRKVSI